MKIARNTKAGKKCPKKGSKMFILATTAAEGEKHLVE